MAKVSKRKACCGCTIVLIILALASIAIYFMVRKKPDDSTDLPVMGKPGEVVKKYGDALKIAMQFFDVQKSGKLVDNNLKWRGDSALDDGKDANVDLSKGMYDAGDHMKFNFPMAFTASVLSWAILEYGDQMQTVDQLKPAQVNLKWITDYLINSHVSDDVLYIQVGNPVEDHSCWNRPEDMNETRPLIQVNTSSPGSDVAAETAAALASASIVFKPIDKKYSGLLLKHAQQLFTFADKNRAVYTKSIPEIQKYYNSTAYEDELLWAASWLYHATGDNKYMDYVTGDMGKNYASWGSPTWFSWDDKRAGTQVLLSRISIFGKKGSGPKPLMDYRKTAEAVMCGFLPKSITASKDRAKSGLIWVTEWNPLQHSMASAFLAVVYSDYMLTSQTSDFSCNGEKWGPMHLRKFAFTQIDYVLGDNPMKMSYVVGSGNKYPKFVHHRGASIPGDATPGCKDGWEKWLESKDENPNVAVGALVGGPFLNETYIDSRNNSMQGEPTTYNSALLVGVLSALVTTSSVVKSFG